VVFAASSANAVVRYLRKKAKTTTRTEYGPALWLKGDAKNVDAGASVFDVLLTFEKKIIYEL
jgi:hypothetical protein